MLRALVTVFLPLLSALPPGAWAESNGIELSATESRWLQENPVIRFAGDPNWLPYEAVNRDGKYVGIVADFLALLEQRLGIEFSVVQTKTWVETVAKVRDGSVDMISETDDSNLTSVLEFTHPYLSSPVVIVMRDGAPFVDHIAQIANRRIAVIREYGYVPAIKRGYPELDYVEVDNIQDGLTAVSTGRVDALFATLAQASYHIGDLGINNVRIVGKTPFETRMAFGVRPELAPLVPLLNHALDTVTSSEKQAILDAWGRQKFADRIDYRSAAIVALVAGVMLLLILSWSLSIRRQKDRLHVSEERFQLAMHAANVGLWDWNAKTAEVYYNPQWMSMLGYEHHELPHHFDTFVELLHPEDRESTLADNERMLKDPTTKYELEFRLRAKDGGYHWILSRGHVISRDAEGNALRALGTHTDITRRKQAELDVRRLNQDLLAANRRSAMAAKAISLGIWERTDDGSDRILFDERMLEIYGFGGLGPREYVTLREWLKRVHPDDRYKATEYLRGLEHGGNDVHAEFRVLRTDGSLRHVYGASTAIRGSDGEPDRFLGVNWDITERKQAGEQFQRVVNTLPVAVMIADSAGDVLLSNPQAAREFGEGSTLVGKNTADLYARADQREIILRKISRDGQVIGEEFQYRSCDGQVVDGLLSALPILFDGKPAVLGVVVNITERRQMERALARAKEQAEAANRFKGQFLANMSHEIRTPMNAIVGLGHLLNRTELTPQQQDYLGKIQVSARSLLSLIDDILDLSKIEAGELRVERIDFTLAEILDNIATLASTRLAEKPVEFVYDIDPAVPGRLRGDPHRLTQILTNLVGNATKFTEQGSIVVRISALQDDDPIRLQFLVQDTGIGIAADKIETLFAPFTQGDGSTTRVYGGTGLGLSICRQLCELMDGSIGAESTLGEGSRFTVQLPFGVPESAPRERALATENLRVLLVDDNTITRQVLGDLLLSLSFKVDVAPSGTAALRRVVEEQRHYDLLLLDWRMPGMDGIETAHAVRGATLDNQPRIILMTAYGREAVNHEINLDGIDAFLVKPITPSQLLDAVTNAMRPHRTEAIAPAVQLTGSDRHRLRGNVLLVEDNPINQQVAREILEKMGLDVRIAANGAQGIEMTTAQRPDLVLMDIQMPDMDGYEATRRIRKLPSMDSLPIVAMTANAMAGDAERSLEAGMDAHIAKPVDPVLLYKTLQAWLVTDERPAPGRSAEIDGDAPPAPSAVSSTGNDGPLDHTTGLMRIGGNRALYARLLDDFATRFHGVVDDIDAACNGEDPAQAESLLHSLQGVAGNIGAGDVHATAARLESSARAGKLEEVHQGLLHLASAVGKACDAARAYTERSEASSDRTIADATGERDICEVLDVLDRLINAGDVEALRLLEKLSAPSRDTRTDEHLARLRTQLQEYDFGAAVKTLAQLRGTLTATPHTA